MKLNDSLNDNGNFVRYVFGIEGELMIKSSGDKANEK